MHVISFLSLVSIICVVIIGLLVMFKVQMKLTKKLFLGYIVGLLLWACSIYFLTTFSEFGVSFSYGSMQYFVLQLVFFGTLILFTFQYWFIKTYPDNRIYNSFSDYLFLLLSLITSVVVFSKDTLFTSFLIHHDGYLIIERGAWKSFFSVHIVVYYFAVIIVLFSKIKESKEYFLKQQRRYLLFSFFTFNSLGILTNWVLSAYLGDPRFNGMGPIFLLINAACFYYIIKNYRFLDVRFNFIKYLQKGMSVLIAGIIYYFCYTGFDGMLSQKALGIISFIISIFSYTLIDKLCSIGYCYRFFAFMLNYHEPDEFKKFVGIFNDNVANYHSIDNLNKDLSDVFCKKLKINFAKIILLNEKTKIRTRSLAEYFKTNAHPLIVQEELITHKQLGTESSLSDELVKYGEICFPIFRRSGKKLIGFFCLGKKMFANPYTKEEIGILTECSKTIEVILNMLEFNSELQKEIEIKTLQLRNQNKKMKGMISQQNDFIRVAAHEFKTPLTIAGLYVNRALKDINSKSSVKSSLKSVTGSIEKIQDLVARLFQVQRYDMDSVSLKKESVNISKFVNDIFQDYKMLMTDSIKNFVFIDNTNKNGKIDIDKIQLTQVMQNLLSNAQKNIQKNGSIRVVLSETEKYYTIHIVDNGRGIEDSNKKLVFQKFKCIDSYSNKGIGLGLYICKKAIELHGGTIWIEDTDGGGATVCVRLRKK